MSGNENTHNQSRIEREEIGRKRNQKVIFGHDNMASVGSRFEFLDLSAQEPRPDCMRQLMTDNIDPHRFGQQQINYPPTRRSGESCDPDGVGSATFQHDAPQRATRADTNRQQQYRNDGFAPFRHPASIKEPTSAHQTFQGDCRSNCLASRMAATMLDGFALPWPAMS